MTCAHCCATQQRFSRRVATKDLQRYQRHGPDFTTGAIIDSIRERQLNGVTLLDVGGGIGVITHELLTRKIVASATLVEAASAYLAVARQEAERSGALPRLQLLHGDFVEVADKVPSADVVTLDRVVCCYPDYRALLLGVAAKCRTALALSYPRDRWYVRMGVALENFPRRLRRDGFRTFVHPPEEMHRLVVNTGFTRTREYRTLAWKVDLYVRGEIHG